MAQSTCRLAATAGVDQSPIVAAVPATAATTAGAAVVGLAACRATADPRPTGTARSGRLFHRVLPRVQLTMGF